MAVRVVSVLLCAQASGGVPAPTALQAAFSRLDAPGLAGTIPRDELPAFIALAAAVDVAPKSNEQRVAVAEALQRQLVAAHGDGPYTIADILRAAHALASMPPTEALRADDIAPKYGSKQLRRLRERLERNRLTMPMFDTKGWVRDFEKSLKIQWEIYASGLQPMHIIVARSDHLYGASEFDRDVSQ